MNKMATTLCDQMLTKIDQMVSNIAQCEAFYQRQLMWACVVSAQGLIIGKRTTVEASQHVSCELFLASVTRSMWLRLELRPLVIKRRLIEFDYLLHQFVGDIQHDD